MSVISTVEAIPSRLKIIYEYLEGKTAEDRSRVMAVLAPRALARIGASGDPSLATVDNSLAEAIQLGLVLNENGKLTARPIDKALRKKYGLDRAFIDLAEWLLLSEESPGRESQRTFPFALAWLLMQSPREPLQFSGNKVNKLRGQIGEGDEYQLTNESSWQNLCYWARALGYCTWFSSNGEAMVISDPTEALRRHLDAMLPAKEPLRVVDALGLLAKRCTVIDGGVVREEVESRSLGTLRESSKLSQSTSFALSRLESLGAVHLRALADAETRTLDVGAGPRPVSHLQRGKGL